MRVHRRATLQRVVEVLAPPDARLKRVGDLAAAAIDRLSPKRASEFARLLDLLALPMLAPPAGRARVLRDFSDSPIGTLRTGFAALKRLTLFLAYAESESGAENPTWPRIAYPGPRTDRSGIAEPTLALASAADGEVVEADVVVIGSGAGGGTAAAEFARAGKRVVVLEAGGACAAQDFTQREIAFGDLYLEGGLCATRDLGVAILAGATLGGGTTVNWSTSFRLPAHVGQEWEAESGVSGLQADLAPHFAALERELGIAQVARHNPNNAVIADGCAALGIHHAAMPRNAPRDCGEGCGYCGFGCAYAKKRSTARALLPDVVANGGSIYARTLVERILFDGRRATGVAACSTGTTGERRFTVRARLVVCAAGALRTPSLLARSGVVHPLLGRRLFLHPVAAAFAEFDRPIRTYLGPMQSAYSDEYAALTGNYGVKIEAAPTHPGLAALALPWRDRQAHAAAMDRIGTMATIFALARDRDPGQVSLDRECTVDYAISPYDAEHLAAGSLALFDIAFAAGATRASSLHNDPIVVERAQWNARRRSELDSQIRTAGFAPNRQPLFSAHQMGTAALGSSPANSVTDPFGRVWNREGLLVADASLFPQSSGVNPMLTIMALARRVANAAS